MIAIIFTLICCAIVTMTVSFTLTQSAIFSKLRIWISKRNKFFAQLFSCPYCMSHWVGFFVTLSACKIIVVPIIGFILLDFLFMWLTVVGLSALILIPLLRVQDDADKDAAAAEFKRKLEQKKQIGYGQNRSYR